MYKSQLKRFTFYKNGDKGDDGRGIGGVIRQYYLSTSKVTPTGGEWKDEAPTWEYGKYLWIRDKISYTDGDTVYTTPYCDSSWEAVNEVDKQILAWCMDNDKTYINGAKIYTGTITADKLKVNSLSSISADIGTITAGTIKGIDIIGSKFLVNKERNIVVTQADLDALDSYFAGTGTLTDEQISRLDVNQDGRISGLDMILCEKILLGQKPGQFTDTISIFNDGVSKIVLSTTNGENTYETIISTGGINTKNIYASGEIRTERVDSGVYGFGDDEYDPTFALTYYDEETNKLLELYAPELPLDIWCKSIKCNDTLLTIGAGETWASGEVPANGYLSGSAKQLWFSIPVGPTMVGITKANCTSLKMNLRTVNGTFVGEGYQADGYEYVGESNYTITTEVNLKTNTIIVGMRQTVSYNATDQSPISVSILDSTFEFE